LCYDSAQYQERADHLLSAKRLTPAQSSQQAYRLPGYPAFLATCYALCGPSPKKALLVQLVLGSFVPVLVYFLACQLFPLVPVVAWGAAWVACVHTGLVIFSGMLATETLAVLLLLFLLLVLFRWPYKLALAGGLLGLLSLLRPIGHYLLPLMVCWLWWQHRSPRQLLWFSGSWLVVVLPWLIRNVLLVGGLCFHTLPGMHFLQYSAVAVVMQQKQKTYVQARSALLNRWDAECHKKAIKQGHAVTEYQRCVLGEELAKKIVLAHPWQAVKHMATELFKTLCALHATQLIVADVGGWPVYTAQTTLVEKICYNLTPPLKTWWLLPIIYADVLATIGLLFFSLIGLFLLLVNHRFGSRHFLALLIAGLLWGVTLAYGCARLRLLFEPIMIMFGVYGAYQLYCWSTGKKTQ
jgi:hypothetical protein